MIRSKKNILPVLELNIFLVIGCKQNSAYRIIVLNNDLDVPRLSETVTIPFTDLLLQEKNIENDWVLKDKTTNTYAQIQFVDENSNGNKDVPIFQTDMAPHSPKKLN